MRLVPASSSYASVNKDQLRIFTCGSVDDGKSTLMGRLLYDTNTVYDDQLKALTSNFSENSSVAEEIDFALLLDGLDVEREQKITIDVAYRFFSTSRRSFVVADTPGHEQYTRNMATGASNAQLAILLVDARKGLLEQTKRHSTICSLLGIRHIVLAINKIDLVDFKKEAFDQIVKEYELFASDLGFSSIVPIPMSARFGDNVVRVSDRTSWYAGVPLLSYLETVEIEDRETQRPFRFPVQWVNRPDPDFRGYAGTVSSGQIATGDEVVALPSRRVSRIKQIVTYDGNLEKAEAGDAVTIVLDDELDVARGDVLARPAEIPEVAEQFAAHIIWMDDNFLVPGRAFYFKVGTKLVLGSVTAIKYKLDINTRKHLAATMLGLNDIGFCNISSSEPVVFDAYQKNSRSGCFIVIDREFNRTVGAGMIDYGLHRSANISWQRLTITKTERALIKGQNPAIIWLTGLSGAGKSTVANLIDQRLFSAGRHTALLDGDNVRHGLSRDLGFTMTDRVENIRRVGEVAKLMLEGGLIVICSFISPYHAERQMVRELVDEGEFIEVFVDTPLDECVRRDPKGFYAKAKSGKIKNFTGMDAPYERPVDPEVHLTTVGQTPEQLAEQVVSFLEKRGVLRSN